MSQAHFRFSVSILRRLGEELNPHPEQGIIELVKNAYDADANECTVEVHDDLTSGGRITITDDGDGLSADDITEGWLVLGTSRKSGNRLTSLGRIPVGSKGLGRLAALRLGTKAILVTRPRSQPSVEHSLVIDWQRFNSVDLVEDVELTISSSAAVNPSSGTTIILEGVQRRIGRVGIKRLARSMLLLADPFSLQPSSFRPKLLAKEYQDLTSLVERKYFSHAEFQLEASIDGKGFGSAKVLDWRGELIFEAGHHELRKESSNLPYQCPKVVFRLWTFLLHNTSFLLRRVKKGEVQQWLKEFGGVHVYQNGVRVEPYGNKGNDWLDMNLLRTSDPQLRPSTSTSIGLFQVEDEGGALKQKTDRSGFLETEAFDDLRTFGRDALEWMARQRIRERDLKRQSERTKVPSQYQEALGEAQKAVELLPAQERKGLESAISKLSGVHYQQVKALNREVQLYRSLSTAGITAAVFAHESSNSPTKIIATSIRTIRTRGMNALATKYSETLAKPVERIIEALGALNALSGVTLGLLDHEKRRHGKVDFHEAIHNILELYGPFIIGRKAEVKLSLEHPAPAVLGSRAAADCIVTNLINNSLQAFDTMVQKARVISIQTRAEENTLVLTVSDSGPGIEGITIKDIWTPGETTRPSGTGLGLTIVKDSVVDLSGQISAKAHGTLGGAEFTIRIPIITQ